ncbi:MAG: ABC transporter related protein [uncultured bacterium (gcode 4)]|uniref:ABC transporter related protein n=1 Tax=uncultured bacterium (gcode 4) TaxID=1234023 RepID=K2GGR1_9BACT|nr:MAG: ABC transporter related protein [uncultured bacterium (gcode 4)]
MNYDLNALNIQKWDTFVSSFKKFFSLIKGEGWKLFISILAIIANSISTLSSPILLAYTIDNYIRTKDFDWILFFAAMLFLIYIVESTATYLQTKTMGQIWINVLYNLRNRIFEKLQNLPIAFFSQNKTWDLISRINSDTEKLNNFFSEALTQFIGSISLITGTWIFLLAINLKLWIITLMPALAVFIITRLISWWVKRKSLASLRSLWAMSSEIQEWLKNFKVMVAYDRLDYFRDKYKKTNDANYKASVGAGVSSNIFTPIYGFAANAAQLLTLIFWIYFIMRWEFTLWLLIWFQFYINFLYSSLREMAELWSFFQLASASLDRISEVISLQSDLPVIPKDESRITGSIMEFENVEFSYPDSGVVLRDVSFRLQKWKTYALVGPTGWWKTTTASLMARLYDPTKGKIYLDWRDIRSYTEMERSEKIGFILQDPFLFSWSVKDNILYWNIKYSAYSNEELLEVLDSKGLKELLPKFGAGLETENALGMSLGQRQIIAFIRAVLKEPELLILDEATANIDTVTEQILEDILKKLPPSTTKIIIAHRLNTIRNADLIFFVNSWFIKPTWSMQDALDMLMSWTRES